MATDVVSPERVVLGGFSQGACLAAEFAARNPRRYGGVFVLSGGLPGPTVDRPAIVDHDEFAFAGALLDDLLASN